MAVGFAPLELPRGRPVLARLMPQGAWPFYGVAALLVFVLMPAGHLLAQAQSLWHVSDYTVTLVGKIMCYAIVALAMD